eukprot:1155146-Pelagomonas_calceolata.AAC.4
MKARVLMNRLHTLYSAFDGEAIFLSNCIQGRAQDWKGTVLHRSKRWTLVQQLLTAASLCRSHTGQSVG